MKEMEREGIIDEVIRHVLDHDVQPGDHAGESGHLAYVTYSVTSVVTNESEDHCLEIDCSYEKHITTEFTWQPDYPPYVYYRSKKIFLMIDDRIDQSGNNVAISEKSFEQQVTLLIENYLHNVDQEYGECRAPVKYPPYFRSKRREDESFLLCCYVDVDLGEDETLAFVSTYAESIIQMIKTVFQKRFGLTAR